MPTDDETLLGETKGIPYLAEKRWALVIGVNETTSPLLAPLRSAEQDAFEMAEVLQRDAGFTLCRPPLIGKDADSQTIKEALLELTQQRNENDFLLLYFGGHGIMLDGELGEMTVYLGSANFKALSPRLAANLHVSTKLLREWLYESTEAGRVLLILDCCFSGEMGRTAPDHYLTELRERIRHYFEGTGSSSEARWGGLRLALTSTGHLATTSEADGYSMTAKLLPALRGEVDEVLEVDGAVSIQSLHRYLERQMFEYPPSLSGDFAGRECILAKHPDKLKERGLQQREQESQEERKQRLYAMLADHTGFLRDRLSSFVGRERELEEIRQRIAEQQPRGGYLTITGQAGQGKSSIIAKLINECGPENVAYHFIPFNPGPDHQVGLLRNLMARLVLKYHLSDLYVTSESRPALRDYFPHVLKEVAANGGKEVIFLDGLDQLEEDATGVRDLSFLPTNPPSGIVFVLGTRPNDTLHPLELLQPHRECKLPNMSREDFDRILRHRQVSLEKTLADRFYRAMQENALYLDLVAQELAQRGTARPEEIIERVTANPTNLFSFSIARLKRQPLQWRELLKPILGILLASREPLSLSHIRQILLRDADRLKDGIARLGGLVSSDGLGRYALFHLKFYDYLRQDKHDSHKDYIFALDEEEDWHRTLANWCERVDIQNIWDDALHDSIEQGRRIYARKHYVTHLYFARDWQRMFEILDAQHFGQKKVRYDPSTRFYSEDLDLGRKAAAGEHFSFEKGISLLPNLWRYTLLRCKLVSRADRYPDAAFRLLMLLGREQEAIGIAELLTDQASKASVLAQMATVQIVRQRREGEPRQDVKNIDLLMRAHEVAYTIAGRPERTRVLRELRIILLRAQQWQEVERSISTIEDSTERANALCELGAAVAQAQHWRDANTILAEAERIIVSIEDSTKRSKALGELGEALVQARQWREAERIIVSIASDYERVKAVHALGVALARAQQWREAERIIVSIASNYERAKALCKLALALTRAQQWREAERIIRSIQDRTEQVRVLGELGVALAQAQQRLQANVVWKEAERIVDSIQDSTEQARVLHELTVARVQREQKANAVWSEAEYILSTIENSNFERVKSLRELAVMLAQARQWKEAEYTVSFIESDYERASALLELGAALVQAQRQQQAEAVWKEAERVIRSIQNSTQRVRMFSELGVALAQAQQERQASIIWGEVETIIRSITVEDYTERSNALCELAVALAQQGQDAQAVLAEAERSIRYIQSDYQRVKALGELGIALAQAQQWQEAERVIDSIGDAIERASALCQLGLALTQAQQWKEANAVWAEVERVFPLGSYLEIRALCQMGVALTEAKREKQARIVWEEAERFARSSSDSRQDRTDLNKKQRELGVALAQAQRWQDAERVIRSIPSNYERIRALLGLGVALEHAQREQQAEAVWRQIVDIIYYIQNSTERAKMLHELRAALVMCNKHRQLLTLVQGSWLNADTQNNAMAFLPLANGLIPFRPEIAVAFYEAFSWVDNFLKG